MILIGNKLFFIVPKTDLFVQTQLEDDPEYIELKYWDTMVEVHRATTGWWYISFEQAERLYGEPIWLAPE